jgi:serine/threonine-protein kinase RIO1
MKKEILKRLKEKNKVIKPWTKQEVKDLKELKDAGITMVTITNDKETMNTLFPGRTRAAVEHKYGRI